METKEYIVILNNYTDLDDFYTDMEQHSQYEYVPNRPVEMTYRRPTSRSTHYLLTVEEVETLKKDLRVHDIIEPYYNLGLELRPANQQTSTAWDKSGLDNTNSLNWGLLRGYLGSAVANWGSDDTPTATGTIDLTNIGNNVDVVINDGHFLPDHPEFAKNPDGTGGSRVVKEVGGTGFDWFKYNSIVRPGTPNGGYVYDFINTPLAIDQNNHGCHVAGTVAGNTLGWARGANIYNFSPYAKSTINATGYTNYIYDMINYITEFHKRKAVNVHTGRRNPTIVNMSYGFYPEVEYADIAWFRYAGVDIFKPAGGWTTADLDNFGLVRRPGYNSSDQLITITNGNKVCYSYRDSVLDNDIADAIAAGVIFCGAAGNISAYNERPGGPMYDNYFVIPSGGVNYAYHYMRGSSPVAATGVIHVSAVDSTKLERKVDFSNAGPRTDIFSAGTNIMSAHNTPGVADPRNSSYYKTNLSGTSMATPQVTGILACALETYPNMTQAQALTYIQTYANSNVLYDSPLNTTYGANQYVNTNTLFNGPNKFAIYHPERGGQYQVYPTRDYSYRPISGRLYPRPRIRRFG
jgi:hypothetical protein